LASLDVSGQRPVSHADASPNEGLDCHFHFKPFFKKVNNQIHQAMMSELMSNLRMPY
jgi:hypothetical protein